MTDRRSRDELAAALEQETQARRDAEEMIASIQGESDDNFQRAIEAEERAEKAERRCSDAEFAREGARAVSSHLREGLRKIATGNVYDPRIAARRLLGEQVPHDTYVDCLDGGYRGYQAACWECDWRGPERLRGDEEMGTEKSRSHKRLARQDMIEHAERSLLTTQPESIFPESEEEG